MALYNAKLFLTHISVYVAQIKKLKKADWHFFGQIGLVETFSTQIQIHKYTNTQIHKYSIWQIARKTHHVVYFWKEDCSRMSKMIFPCVKSANTKIQIHKYTNTQIHKYSIWQSARNTHHVVYFWRDDCSRISKMIFPCVKSANTKIQIHKYTNTQIQQMTKCQKNPTKTILTMPVEFNFPALTHIHTVYKPVAKLGQSTKYQKSIKSTTVQKIWSAIKPHKNALVKSSI